MKRILKSFVLSLVAVFVAGCTMDEDYSRRVQPDPQDMRGPGQVEPGCLIVKMKNEPEDPMALASAFPELEIKSVRRLYAGPEKFEARKREMGLHLWYAVEFDDSVPVTRAASDMDASGDMELVSYVYSVKYADATYPFDDPKLPDQWHYMNFGEKTGEVAGSDINLFPAWEITTGRQDVIVAVTDGGVDYNHEDLAYNMWCNEAELNGQPGVDDDGNGFVDDIYGYNFLSDSDGSIVPEDHGTHVAGTVAAVNNNGIGVAGVAGGDYANGVRGASIMSCQTSPGAAYISEAFIYAADNGAVISQNSWSVGRDYSSVLGPAMDYFIKYAGMDENGNQVGPMAGGIIIFAAANESTNESYPADADEVFAVASIGADYKAAYYTNYGEWVEVSAPGGDAYKGYEIMSTLPNNRYGTMQGTSMACPHVSGVAALVVSAFGKEGFTNEDLWTILSTGVRNIDEYNPNFKGLLGAGLIDAEMCLKSFGPEPPDPVTDLEAVSAQGSSIVLKWTVPEDVDSYKPVKFNIFTSTSTLESLDPSNPGENVMVSEVPTGTLLPGDVLETTVSGLLPVTEYHFRVQSEDNMGSVSSLSNEVVFSTVGNTPPVITPITGTEVTLKAYETVRVEFAVSDADNDDITYELDPGTDAASATYRDGILTVVINGLNAPVTQSPATYVATITVSDGFDEASAKLNYTVIPNSEPVVDNPIADQVLNSATTPVNVDISSVFSDPDGEPLNYSVAVSGTVVRANINGSELRITPSSYGVDTVTLTATDLSSASVSSVFTVLVRDGNKAADLYPNPVTDILNIRTGEAASSANVQVKAANGAVVLEQDGLSISPFSPAQIDMSSLAGGIYKVTVTYTTAGGDSRTITSDIAKL